MFALIVALVVGQTVAYAGNDPFGTPYARHGSYAGNDPFGGSSLGYAHRHYGHYYGGRPYLYGGWATPGYYLPYGSSVVWPPRYWGRYLGR